MLTVGPLTLSGAKRVAKRLGWPTNSKECEWSAVTMSSVSLGSIISNTLCIVLLNACISAKDFLKSKGWSMFERHGVKMYCNENA